MKNTQPSQEDLQIINNIKPFHGHTLSGFAQGEGSFHLVARKRKDFYYGYRFTIGFNVSNKDPKIINLFKKILKCGNSRGAGMISGDKFYMYEVDSTATIIRRIIPFFKRFGFLNDLSRGNFSKFCKMAKILDTEKLTLEDILNLLKLRSQLHNAPKHKSDLVILTDIKDHLESRIKENRFKTPEELALGVRDLSCLSKECNALVVVVAKQPQPQPQLQHQALGAGDSSDSEESEQLPLSDKAS